MTEEPHLGWLEGVKEAPVTAPEEKAEGEMAPPNRGAVPAPVGTDDPNYHCPNCLFIPMPSDPAGGFWACQNLCERD